MYKETVAETDKFVIIYKPAGIAVESRNVAEADLYHLLLREHRELHMINRLDQPVEGLVLFAKDRRTAGILSGELSDGRMKKEYLAVVSGRPATERGVLKDMLLRDGRKNISSVVPAGTSGAKYSELSYETIGVKETDGREYTLLSIVLKTGRHHQIRVQLSHMGCPVAGDRKYGGDCAPVRFPALCAFRLTFDDPADGKRKTYETVPKGELFRAFAPTSIDI